MTLQYDKSKLNCLFTKKDFEDYERIQKRITARMIVSYYPLFFTREYIIKESHTLITCDNCNFVTSTSNNVDTWHLELSSHIMENHSHLISPLRDYLTNEDGLCIDNSVDDKIIIIKHLKDLNCPIGLR